MTKQKPKIEYVDFVISLPKQVLDFLEAHKKDLDYANVKAYITLGVLQMVRRDMEAEEFDRQTRELIDAILKDDKPTNQQKTMRGVV